MSDKTFTPFHLSVSDVQEVFRNVDFPHTQKINNLQKFQDATKFDHCVAKFVDDKRAKRNFITADCIFLDIDNDDTLNPQEWDDPKLWMTLARFRKNFEGIEHIIQPSKSHRKEKDGRQQRDRFHVYFPLNHIISSGKDYEEHINLLVSLYVRPDGISFFDTKAVDCSRLFYGNKKGIASAPEWYKGKSVLDWMADHPQTKIIKEQNHKKNTLPGVGSIQGSSQESQGKHLWMAGWQYKKLIKGNPVEIFYGDLSIKTENETSWSVRCSSGKHEDKEASLQIDKMTYSWNCWAGCGKGNVFDFIAMRDNNHKDNVVDDFCNILDMTRSNNTPPNHI